MTSRLTCSARRVLFGIAFAQLLGGAAPVVAQGGASIADLSIEDLLKLPVTSVSRRAQALSDAPAAVFVINADDIRRSGATSIPEALRLAPGVQVAQSRSGSWAVTARGFNGRYANKLLVLMDGRVIYSPLFSGVFWEAQGAAMQDIDRIEVIRGPQAALWGANAVNGVINIITRDAHDTQGTQASVTVGNPVTGGVSLRHGGRLSEQTRYRLFANGLDREASVDLSGNALPDRSTSGHVGFRVDSRPNGTDRISLIGNVQRARNDDVWNEPGFVPPYNRPVSFRQIHEGVNLTGRFDRVNEDGSSWMVQAYLDATSLQGYMGERRHTADVEFQHRFQWGGGNDIVWGGNYRTSHDDIRTSVVLATPVATSHFSLASLFLQNETALLQERLRLTLGGRVEYNTYTGVELQPSARAAWTPAPGRTFWSSASRATRTPSRIERDFVVARPTLPPFTGANPTPLPVVTQLRAGPQLRSEVVDAFEVGFRAQLAPQASVDIAAFANRYRSLRGAAPGVVTFVPPYLLQQVQIDNRLDGLTRGVEVSLDWRPLSWWRLQPAYTWMTMSLPAQGDPAGALVAAVTRDTTPEQQFSLRSSMDLSAGRQFDLWLRYVDDVRLGNVPSYWSLDMRYAVRLNRNVELSLVGQNVLDRRRPEFVNDFVDAPVAQVPRGGYVRINAQF